MNRTKRLRGVTIFCPTPQVKNQKRHNFSRGILISLYALNWNWKSQTNTFFVVCCFALVIEFRIFIFCMTKAKKNIYKNVTTKKLKSWKMLCFIHLNNLFIYALCNILIASEYFYCNISWNFWMDLLIC